MLHVRFARDNFPFYSREQSTIITSAMHTSISRTFYHHPAAVPRSQSQPHVQHPPTHQQSRPRVVPTGIFTSKSQLLGTCRQTNRMAIPPASSLSGAPESVPDLHPDVLTVVFTEQHLQQAAQELGRRALIAYSRNCRLP